MLQTRSVINIIDNTDVISVRCFKPRGIMRLGDLVPCSVVKIGKAKGSKGIQSKGKIASQGNTTGRTTFKRGDVVHALVVNTISTNRRGFKNNGIRTSFGGNTGIIMINSGKEGWIPVGTRIMGAIPRSLREKGWSNVVGRAEYVV